MDYFKGPSCIFINILMDQYFAYKTRLCDLDLNVNLEGLSSSPLSFGQYFDKIQLEILWANLRYANWYLMCSSCYRFIFVLLSERLHFVSF